MNKWDRMNAIALLLGVLSLFMEQGRHGVAVSAVLHAIDFSMLGLILWSAIGELRSATFKAAYARANWWSIAFVVAFAILFCLAKYQSFFAAGNGRLDSATSTFRDLFLILKIASRFGKLYKFIERLAAKPAQTVVVSFLLAILAGTLFLMMRFSTADGEGLGFLNALFTSTSAVCVTGLAVVDTATALSRGGQAVVLALIQIGGLGIMAFSYFLMMALRRRFSLRDRLTVSFMLSEDDMSGLSANLRSIVLSTFGIELVGALALFSRFAAPEKPLPDAIFEAVFHAVSAFCNAGFALRSDSLESFRRDPAVTLSIASLIVLGGIGFGVIRDVRSSVAATFRKLLRRDRASARISSQNTRVVIAISAVLIAIGFAGFYLLEHRGVMADYGLGEQYMGALFQSITLRTAGFNSVPFGSLRDATLVFMISLMFIGGASGSTAGGIKVNTLAALGSYFMSFLRQEKAARIGTAEVSADKVGRAFLILIFGLCAVFLGTFVLSMTENAPFLSLLFESVSAFGTVGLSVGVTPTLSEAGKVTIVFLMFMGRLGPLTLLTAASRKRDSGSLEYPQGDLSIG